MTTAAARLEMWLLAAELEAASRSNARLLERARRGEPEAFEEIVKQHQGRVYNLAYRMLRRREDAEDVTQEAFLKSFEALPRLRNVESFAAWLNRIAANLCMARLRKASAREAPTDPASLTEQAEEETRWADLQMRENIKDALAQLPPRYRLAIASFYLEGRSYEEAARIAAVPVRTFKTWLYRARRMLREILNDEIAGG